VSNLDWVGVVGQPNVSHVCDTTPGLLIRLGQNAVPDQTTVRPRRLAAFFSFHFAVELPLARLGDLPLVLELKLQLFNDLGQPLSCQGVCGLQGELADLLQLSFQYCAPHAYHLGAPVYPEFSKMCTDTLTIR
jgi:hypothetical protein